jgi:ribosomal protein S25
MTPAIVTLIAGIIIVCVSFFIIDGHNYKEEDEVFDESSSEMKRRLQELGEDLIRQYQERIVECNSEAQTKYEAELKEEIEKVSAQLSEKAKQEMIEYINSSLADAYAAYNPDAEAAPSPITYEESPENTNDAEALVEDAVAEEEAAPVEEEQTEAEVTVSQEEQSEEKPEAVEAAQPEENPEAGEAAQPEEKPEAGEAAQPEEKPEAVEAAQSEEKPEAGEAAQSEEKPEAGDAAQSEAEPTSQDKENKEENHKPENKTSGKKKKKKNKNKNNNKQQAQKEIAKTPVPDNEIWDDEKDINKEVAALYNEGFSIMEIANQLGIGVGEAKVIIKNLEEHKQ